MRRFCIECYTGAVTGDKSNMHITMMIRNGAGKAIQCVIDDEDKGDFEALGFVDHDSKLKPKTKPRAKSKAKVKINAE